MKLSLLASSLLVALAGSSTVMAAPIVFNGSSGSLTASVSFDTVGTDLHVILTNASLNDVLVPTDVLTGVFFNIAGNPALTRISGISLGPTYLNGILVNPAGTIVGGEWAYLNGLAQYAANSGISSSGLNIFGPGNRFPGPNLAGPASPDGLQYGLTSAGDNLSTQNGGIANNELTKNAVEFVLGGFNSSLTGISSVTFQYGTATDEPHFPGTIGGGGVIGGTIPEPASLALVGIALAAAAGVGRATRRRAVCPLAPEVSGKTA